MEIAIVFSLFIALAAIIIAVKTEVTTKELIKNVYEELMIDYPEEK